MSPSPMLSVADLIVSQLREAGTGFLFGVPGGGSNLDLIEAGRRAGLPFVLTSMETAGAIAALAQAEILGRPGACLTTLGPGVSSAVSGIACALLERAPLLVFADSQPEPAEGVFEHQRLDHEALLAPVTKWSAVLGDARTEDTLRQAIESAMRHPRGPVGIQLSVGGSRPSVGHGRRSLKRERVPGGVKAEGQLWRLVTAARRPLLIVGLGAARAPDAAAIRALCASHGVPAMVTYKAKGVVPDDDPHFAGVFTNAAIERPIVDRADLLIGIGLDPVELIPRPWKYRAPVVNCGPWAVDAGHVPFAAHLVADVPAAMQRIGERLPSATWDLDDLQQRVTAQRERLCPHTGRLAAHRVVQVTAAVAGARTRVTVDAGAHMFPATMLWPVAEPNGMLISNGLSTMGFALPAAIGAALLNRHEPVIALTGDGGLLMCAGELLTAVRERLRVVVIVFNDAALSLIDVKQRQRGYEPAGVALGHVSWSRIAEGFGAAPHVVDSEADLERALARALHHQGPSLIDARIDAGSYAETLRAIRG